MNFEILHLFPIKRDGNSYTDERGLARIKSRNIKSTRGNPLNPCTISFIVYPGTLLFLISLLVLAGCTVFTPATPTPLPTIVLDQESSALPTSPQIDSGAVVASGSMTPAQEARLVFTLGGKVAAVNVSVGEAVAEGQVLAQLEGQESLGAAVSAAEFELEQAQQALDALSKDMDVQLAQALKAIADYQDALRDAERALSNMQAAAPQVDIDTAYANMILAQDKLDKARDDFEPFENKPETNVERAAMLSRLAQAQKDYDATVRTYNHLIGTTNSIDQNQAEADLALAQAQLAKAQRDYDILSAGPDPDQVRLAEARLKNARTQLEAAQAALEQLTLAAPFAGVVAQVNISSGEWVTPGQPILVLADIQNLHVETSDLSERDLPKIAIGQSVMVFVKALGEQFSGRVSNIAPLAETLGGDVVYTTTIELDAPPPGLRAGMSVEVQFETE
ncbi:MAG: HlyD family efflux transporter periplasmic adaptor subunit [Chloroflexi bacterium]|nr:HlyD family efflux transporter periplasmic adaptor subunit [Chloroflexota bacterium]